MNVMDRLLKKRKVTKTTTVIEEVEECEHDDNTLKETVVQELKELDSRVRMLELELELYGREG